MNEMRIYNIPHIIFLITITILITLQFILVHKHKPSKKFITIYSDVIASIILICVIITRIFDTKFNIDNNVANSNWIHVIPSTWCSLCGLLYFINIVFLKRNNKMSHFVGFLGLMGGIMAVVFPNFLAEMTFFDVRSFPSLIYHFLMILLTLFLIQTKEFVPTLKNAKYFIIGMFFFMLIGAFEKHIMKMIGPMQLDTPFFKEPKALEIITSWPMVIFGELIVVVITCYLFDLHNKKHNNTNDEKSV